MGEGSNLTDEELVYGYLGQYLDDELPEDIKTQFEKAIGTHPDELKDKYRQARGYFQVALQSCALSDQEIRNLYRLVEDDASRVNHEAESIAWMGKAETVRNIVHNGTFLGILLLTIFGMFYYLTPPSQPPFNALETLVYEALAMEEDQENRLDFPTSSLEEAQEYITRYPDIGFVPNNLSSIGGGWEVDGSSVIDYDIAKIVVVQYRNIKLNEKLFIFQYSGKIEDLPPADPGNMNGLLYQTYGSDDINVIAWEIQDGIMGFMVSHQSAPEMAKMAKMATNI